MHPTYFLSVTQRWAGGGRETGTVNTPRAIVRLRRRGDDDREKQRDTLGPQPTGRRKKKNFGDLMKEDDT